MLKRVASLTVAAIVGAALGISTLVFGQPGTVATEETHRYAVKCFLEFELEKNLNELAKADDWRLVSALPSGCTRKESGQAVKKQGVLVILEQ